MNYAIINIFTCVFIIDEYQYGRVLMVFKNLCNLVLSMKVDLALEGLRVMTKNIFTCVPI